jgi:hypothetical protein
MARLRDLRGAPLHVVEDRGGGATGPAKRALTIASNIWTA